jgi:ABC-2 type transport system ATP-binding protein
VPAAIVVQDVRATYGRVVAVDGVSFTIERGECFGLLGPNGAGKTTLLSCLEGLKRFEPGKVLVHQVDITKDPVRVKRSLGVQLQDAALFPDLTAVEIVQFYGALYDVFPTGKEALTFLEKFQLADKAKARIEELSGGQQQRLTLALALVHDPPTLLLDEPTTGLDPRAKHNIWDLVRRLRDEGKTIVLTTHNMEEAELLCHRVGIIDHGRLLALDSPRALVKGMGDMATVMVRVYLPPEKVRQLEALAGVSSVTYESPDLSLQTSQPEKVLATLGTLGGGEPKDVVVRRPNLEDVFLSLTGRALR